MSHSKQHPCNPLLTEPRYIAVHQDLVYDDLDGDHFIMYETTYNGQGSVRFGFCIQTPAFDYYICYTRQEIDFLV